MPSTRRLGVDSEVKLHPGGTRRPHYGNSFVGSPTPYGVPSPLVIHASSHLPSISSHPPPAFTLPTVPSVLAPLPASKHVHTHVPSYQSPYGQRSLGRPRYK